MVEHQNSVKTGLIEAQRYYSAQAALCRVKRQNALIRIQHWVGAFCVAVKLPHEAVLSAA